MKAKYKHLFFDGSRQKQWTSKWYDCKNAAQSAKIIVDAKINLFDNKTIEVVVDGSKKPYTDADGVAHDWYGRCMIAIIDENRWIMAIRSGVNHISWGRRDTIHLITSNDEGRTWGKLDRWFDGTPIKGMPYEDGKTHSEPGIYKMPNGDIILQFWKDSALAGTKQMRSKDNGKTWVNDIDQINVKGVKGKPGDMAIGTQNCFVDPENPSDVYMAFEYFSPNKDSFQGSLLTVSRDNGKSYSFLSWLAPKTCPNFEPAIEYVGNRTIVAVLRGYANDHTWQSKSTDMGASFGPPVEISAKINGGISNGLWQRARLYKESNPSFRYNNPLDFKRGEGRLWGFGIHSMGGGHTRKPVVYWSDDNGESWCGPQLLHGPMHPGTDTGYGDMKRRIDNTFVAATYYCIPRDSSEADVEQYTFGGKKATLIIETDRDGNGVPEADSQQYELHSGKNVISLSSLFTRRWRFRLLLSSGVILQVKLENQH